MNQLEETERRNLMDGIMQMTEGLVVKSVNVLKAYVLKQTIGETALDRYPVTSITLTDICRVALKVAPRGFKIREGDKSATEAAKQLAYLIWTDQAKTVELEPP